MSKTKPKYLTFSLIIPLIMASWAACVLRVLHYCGDRMILMHPVVMSGVLMFVLQCAFAIAAIVFLLRKRPKESLISLSSAVAPVLVVFVVIAAIGPIGGWERPIQTYNVINRQAIASTPNIPEYDPNEWIATLIDNDDKLAAISGFEWFSPQHIAAPNGVFRAFRIRRTVHVRVQRYFRGWAGIALLPNPQAFEQETAKSPLKYERTEDPNWLIWSCND